MSDETTTDTTPALLALRDRAVRYALASDSGAPTADLAGAATATAMRDTARALLDHPGLRPLATRTLGALARTADLLGRYAAGERNFSRADLSDADLSGADLSRADLSRAVLSDADLSDADLSGADLSGAVLSRADLSRAVLSGADLSDAVLSRADLSRAVLSDADLSDADLSDADLSGAVLSGADLSDADLSGADLSGAVTDSTPQPERVERLRRSRAERAAAYRAANPDVPVVERLDERMAEVTAPEGTLRMSDWHTCETTHCRAGWAIHLAGPAGYELESRVGPQRAGAMIYRASTGRTAHFFATNERARRDIERRAAESRAEREPAGGGSADAT